MRILTSALALGAMALTLSACGSSNATFGEKEGELTPISYVLKDGMTIDCVLADGTKSSDLDCHWDSLYSSDFQASDNTDVFTEREVKFSTGRTVRCVEANGNLISGVSCDWAKK